jgi:hypothetical protein
MEDAMHALHSQHSQSQWDVWLAGEPLEYSRHVCGFFRTPEEADDLILPFLKEGIDGGERAFYVVDSDRRVEQIQRLEHLGIDAANAERSGQLEVRGWDNAYLREGYFDQAAMLTLVEEALVEGRARGFRQTRLVGRMEWASKDLPGVEDLLEYETRFNYVSARNGDPVICTYDLASFGAGLIVDILRTHPYVIIGGILQENPFFVPPDQMLQELRGRSYARSYASSASR